MQKTEAMAVGGQRRPGLQKFEGEQNVVIFRQTAANFKCRRLQVVKISNSENLHFQILYFWIKIF